MHNYEIRLDYRGPKEFAPHYATKGAAGLDLCAVVEAPVVVHPYERILIPTKLWLQMPYDVEMQIRSKSGLALKWGVIVLNAPATIDSDYKDEVGVLLLNAGDVPFIINPGIKIAQAVFNKVNHAPQGFTLKTLDRTGGFGSTGK